MEITPEEVTDLHSGHHIMPKGKRTKRQRSSPSPPPPPPPPLAYGTMTSSSGCQGSKGADNISYLNNNSASSPTTSSGETSTEEDEDMANCLILLAQGEERRLHRRRRRSPQQSRSTAPLNDLKIEKLQVCTPNLEEISIATTVTTAAAEQTATAVTTDTTNKSAASFFVYDCKTCNRSFPSFQALGGHRASHKKALKPNSSSPNSNSNSNPHEESKPAVVNTAFMKEFHELYNEERKISLPISQNNNSNNTHTNQKVKIHECSICGSEFASGQALGGHMRRHRVVATSSSAAAASASVSVVIDDHHHDLGNNEMVIKRSRNILALDLNLPAPDDDLSRESNIFQFGSSSQQGGVVLVLSAPPLVDCHY